MSVHRQEILHCRFGIITFKAKDLFFHDVIDDLPDGHAIFSLPEAVPRGCVRVLPAFLAAADNR